MKKTIKIAMVAVVAAIAGMGIYSSQKADTMSDIALANVEALARYELPEYEVKCGSDGGRCWQYQFDCTIGGATFEDCVFSGYTYTYCITPCL